MVLSRFLLNSLFRLADVTADMPLKLSDADKPSVFDHLKEIGCCKFCAERFSGERYYDHYKKFEELAALSVMSCTLSASLRSPPAVMVQLSRAT